MTKRAHERLPLWARALIGALAGPLYRDHILGDLEEQIQDSVEPQLPDFALWKEVLATIPGLLALRAQDWKLKSIAMTLIVTVAAYGLLILWSLNVLRPIMIGMRDSFGQGAMLDYATFYLLVRMPGVMIASAGIAYLLFEPRTKFVANFAQKLLPLLLIMVLPQVWFGLMQSGAGVSAQDLIRFMADGLVVTAGGYLGWRFKQRRKRR